jgi:hypothetical protein
VVGTHILNTDPLHFCEGIRGDDIAWGRESYLYHIQDGVVARLEGVALVYVSLVVTTVHLLEYSLLLCISDKYQHTDERTYQESSGDFLLARRLYVVLPALQSCRIDLIKNTCSIPKSSEERGKEVGIRDR